MSSRFIMNLVVLIGGGVAVVSSQAFDPTTAGWTTFGIALGILGVVAISHRDGGRRTAQALVDAATGTLAVWAVVASVVFHDATLTWLSFGEAVAFVALAVAGLTAHELSTERIVHTFASSPSASELEANAGHYSAAA